MSRVVRSPQAEMDLVEIGLYIARDNPRAADRLLDEIERKCNMLARQPLIGEIRDDLQPDLRSFSVGNYVIFYRPMTDGMELIRVLHGARDMDRLF